MAPSSSILQRARCNRLLCGILRVAADLLSCTPFMINERSPSATVDKGHAYDLCSKYSFWAASFDARLVTSPSSSVRQV
ncbi:unnamed protein product [Peniophora sp. CBMAI 1063]|nr:unnamed protein product [Peniophora sp. CBMAI 1063]